MTAPKVQLKSLIAHTPLSTYDEDRLGEEEGVQKKKKQNRSRVEEKWKNIKGGQKARSQEMHTC